MGGARHLSLRLPVVVLVLAFTAVPIRVRPVDAAVLSQVFNFSFGASDIIANVIGFIPVGMVLATRSWWTGVGAASALSLCVEMTQLFSRGRSPSLIDVASNVAGAGLGIVVCALWPRDFSAIRLGTRTTSVAALCGLTLSGMLAIRTAPDDFSRLVRTIRATTGLIAVSDRGATAPGRLEGAWTFEVPAGRSVPDDSGNGLTADLVSSPGTVPGIRGRALRLDGRTQWVDLGDPLALRLTGSMTISAWINPAAFPRRDAAIVSSLDGFGFQLDTTLQQGFRAVRLTLTNDRGEPAARYGRTLISTNRWYHVAGVYDAGNQTMNVYVNGQLDNGCSSGVVTSRQWVSGKQTLIGRRAGQRGSEFEGVIDDVRIYSRALTQRELVGDMGLADPPSTPGAPTVPENPCVSTPVESFDDRVAGPVTMFGALAAVIVAGVWPSARWRVAASIASGAVGLLLVPVVGPLVPAFFRVLIPLLSLAGGFSVIASVLRRDTAG